MDWILLNKDVPLLEFSTQADDAVFAGLEATFSEMEDPS